MPHRVVTVPLRDPAEVPPARRCWSREELAPSRAAFARLPQLQPAPLWWVEQGDALEAAWDALDAEERAGGRGARRVAEAIGYGPAAHARAPGDAPPPPPPAAGTKGVLWAPHLQKWRPLVDQLARRVAARVQAAG